MTIKYSQMFVRRIAALCKRRLMLTGTPLQNDLMELQNLLSFLLPDVFRADVAEQLADEQARMAAYFLDMLGVQIQDV